MDIAKMEVSSGAYQAQVNRMNQAGGAQHAAEAYGAKAPALHQGWQTPDTVSISPEGASRAAALAVAVASTPCEQD